MFSVFFLLKMKERAPICFTQSKCSRDLIFKNTSFPGEKRLEDLFLLLNEEVEWRL